MARSSVQVMDAPGAPGGAESESFEERVYKLFSDETVNPLLKIARLGQGRYEHRPLKARLLRDVPGDAALRERCNTSEDLLSVSGIRVDAADIEIHVRHLRNVARWWWARRGVRSWRDTLWRAVIGALQRPIHHFDSFGASERNADHGTRFSLKLPIGIDGYGIVVSAHTFHQSDISNEVDVGLRALLPEVPDGALRLFHGTTAMRATSIITEGVSARHVRTDMKHDFGEAFSMTLELPTVCYFAFATALGDGQPGSADNDATVLILDVNRDLLDANLVHYKCDSLEPWQHLLRHYVRGRGLPEGDIARAYYSDVIHGPLCKNNNDVAQSDQDPIPDETRTQCAFKAGKGMDFVSVGKAGSGVMAVYLLRANLDDDACEALFAADT